MSKNNVGSVSVPLRAIFSNQSDQPSNNVLGRIRFGNQLDLSGGENEPPLLTIPMMNSVQKEFLESWVGGNFYKIWITRRVGLRRRWGISVYSSDTS